MPEYLPDLAARKETEFQIQLRRSFGPEIARARADKLREAEREEAARVRAERLKQWAAEDEKRRKETDQRREEDRVARVTAAEAELKERMRFAFLQQPGSTEAGFAKAWPRLLEDHQIRETLAGTAGSLAESIHAEMKAARPRIDFFEKSFEKPTTPAPVAVESD